MMFFYSIFIAFILASCSFSDDDGGVVSSHSPSDVYNNQLIADNLPSFCESSGCVASDFETDEYYTNFGGNQNFLGQINSSSAYAYLANAGKNWGGNDVKVAVVDSGVLSSHSDLDDNYSNASEPSSNQDIIGHGTHIAGIIAAEKNNNIMHGVAPYASIVSIASQGLSDGQDNMVTYGSNDWKHEVKSSGSTIVNLSWGSGAIYSSETFNDIVNVINDNSKRVVLVAAGNDDTDNPEYPARNANHTSMKGQMLAIGSVDSSNNRSDWGNGIASSKCGVTKDFCAVAPGHYIFSTYNNGSYAFSGGTSMATPVVAGMVAVLQSAWPSLTGAQIVDLLLSTATDLGDAGVDDEFGHGLLNLYAAASNQGTSSVYLNNSGIQYLYNNSNIYIPSTMGAIINNTELRTLLSEGVFFDSYGRDYQDDYNKKLKIYGQHDKFFNFFSDNDIETQNIGFNNKNNLTLHLSRNIDTNANRFKFSTIEQEQYHLNNISYNFNVGEVAFNIGKSSQFSSIEDSFDYYNLITKNNFLSSYDQISDYDILNFNSNIKINNKVSLQNKFIYGENQYTNAPITGIINQLSHSFYGMKFNYEWGIYKESDGFFGVSGVEAFNVAEYSNNQSFSVSIFNQQKRNWHYFVSSKWDRMTPKYNNSLISGGDKFNALSYVFGVIYNKNKDNKIGASIAKPWTINKGYLTFTVPTGLDHNGTVKTKSVLVNLSSYNEYDYEVFWHKNLRSDDKIKFHIVQRLYDVEIPQSNIKDSTEFYVRYTKSF